MRAFLPPALKWVSSEDLGGNRVSGTFCKPEFDADVMERELFFLSAKDRRSH